MHSLIFFLRSGPLCEKTSSPMHLSCASRQAASSSHLVPSRQSLSRVRTTTVSMTKILLELMKVIFRIFYLIYVMELILGMLSMKIQSY